MWRRVHGMPPSLAEQHTFLDHAKAYDFVKVRALVDQDISYVNCQPSGRWTALHQACHQGDAHTVEFLLARGADITATTRDGEAAKDIATSRGHHACAKLIDESTIATGKNKGKSKASASPSGGPAPKSQKVSMKNGVAQIKFDATGASASGTQIVKGQCAVDSACPIAADLHVYEADDDDVYDATLNQTDISVNANKYYILQVLETDALPHQYYTWNRWGRVGEERNKQNQLLGPMSLEEALKDHKKKFKDKTKNEWADRSDFVKHDKKYQYIERDYGAEQDDD